MLKSTGPVNNLGLLLEIQSTRNFKKILFLKNSIILDKIWPRPEDDAHWEQFSLDYTRQMESDKTHYLTHNNNGLWVPLEYNHSNT